MMLAIYFTLGVFLLLAVRNPPAHRSLIAFTGWSSLAHAAVMALQSIQLGSQSTELPPLIVVAFLAVALLLLAEPKRVNQPDSQWQIEPRMLHVWPDVRKKLATQAQETIRR